MTARQTESKVGHYGLNGNRSEALGWPRFDEMDVPGVCREASCRPRSPSNTRLATAVHGGHDAGTWSDSEHDRYACHPDPNGCIILDCSRETIIRISSCSHGLA